MTETPLPEINSQPVFAVQQQALMEALNGNGTAAASDLEVTDGPGDNESEIAAGTGYYDGASGSLGASTTVPHSDGDGNDDRWDLVAFDVAAADVVLHEGTPAAGNPTPPDLQADEILLAVVYIESEQTDFGDSEIVNFRVPAGGGRDHQHTAPGFTAVPNDGIEPLSLGGLGLPNHHIEYSGGLSDEELSRFQLPSDERLEVYSLDLEVKGGGSDANLTLELYDNDASSVVASTTAGTLSTGDPIGTSGTGATILVRLSTGSSGPYTLAASGTIDITKP